MNHLTATYIDFIQSLGSITISIAIIISLKAMYLKSNKVIIKSDIRLETNEDNDSY